jgi:mannan endo-1,4-beta-mannosidase
MTKRLWIWLAAGVCLGCGAGFGQEPANTNASPATRAVLKYIQSLEPRTSKRLLSGQFTDFGQRAELGQIDRVHQKNGHWPALIGVDYADFGHGGLTFETPNRTAIEYWKQGGLVTVSAHLYNPANPSGGGLRDKGVDLSALLAPDSETHTRWMTELDQLAGGLKELKDAGVVVIWRPFHEMNGDWFWWGAKDTNAFIKVWRHMFDNFSSTKGLDNLLWAYSPNHGNKTAAYYPGDQYADLVGLDAYTDFVDTGHIHGYVDVAKLNKPFGFTEYGPHGSQNPPGDYDYMRFIRGVEKDFPRTVLFMSWNYNWSLARNTNTAELLNHSWIVNREDLPKGLAAKNRE